jgi:tetratricopeptide (TPR) repeat protein
VSVPGAPTELVPARDAPGAGVAAPAVPVRGGWQRRAHGAQTRATTPALWWPTLLIAAILCLIAFYAKGGLNLESMTATEMALTLGAGVVVAAAAIAAPSGARAYGLWPVGLLLAFTVLTALSIVWSVQPDHSWQDSGRMLAYSGVFGAGVALVRIAPGRWPALLGGLTLAAVVVCGYALATKVFPSLAPSNTFARLNEPYKYWNAVGLTAAMGAIGCMWLGARRNGHALLRALAYPAMGLLLVTLVLAYSRGALAALALGLVLWFCLVPLRLRGAAVLIVGMLGAGAVVAWDFSRHALSSEGVPLGERATAGHQLGALVVAMLALLAVAGIAIGFATGRRAPARAARRQAGAALLALLALAAIAFAGALAHSQRGLTGSVSHAFNALTNPNAKPPPNTPGRLTAVASVRARYWKEAWQVFKAHPALGAGAEGYATAHLRYETETLEVRHAHGFIVQTLADLGLVGLVLALALLIAWMAAAGRATHPFNRRWTGTRAGTPRRAQAGRRAWLRNRFGERPGWRRLRERELIRYTPERIGMLSMLCLVVVFGAHSLIDWTWYVPGDACVALLCAGWLAGRGPLIAAPREEARRRARAQGRPGYVRLCVAAAAIVAALLAAWSQWQPQRSEEARQETDALLEAHDLRAATAAANRAVSRDPLSVEALFTLASVEQVSGRPALARATLERAVRLQPSNPQTWLALGRYDVKSDPQAAVQELRAAIYLNPESIAPEAIAAGRREAIEVQNDYIQALRAAMQQESLRRAAALRASARAAAALKSANGSRARAAAGGRPAGRPRRAPRSARSRTPRSAG